MVCMHLTTFCYDILHYVNVYVMELLFTHSLSLSHFILCFENLLQFVAEEGKIW